MSTAPNLIGADPAALNSTSQSMQPWLNPATVHPSILAQQQFMHAGPAILTPAAALAGSQQQIIALQQQLLQTLAGGGQPASLVHQQQSKVEPQSFAPLSRVVKAAMNEQRAESQATTSDSDSLSEKQQATDKNRSGSPKQKSSPGLLALASIATANPSDKSVKLPPSVASQGVTKQRALSSQALIPGSGNSKVSTVSNGTSGQVELASPVAGGKISKRRRRQETHNVAEQRRRQRMNNLIEDLRACVPSLRSPLASADKATVLSTAIAYIKQLENKVSASTSQH